MIILNILGGLGLEIYENDEIIEDTSKIFEKLNNGKLFIGLNSKTITDINLNTKYTFEINTDGCEYEMDMY